ncbi:MAG: choice-of-anchor J domain-containing protein [Chloroflexi bacterium]|nr:choice-of-anchor J domain-containing protein [Chloroflexota bacterium]
MLRRIIRALAVLTLTLLFGVGVAAAEPTGQPSLRGGSVVMLPPQAQPGDAHLQAAVVLPLLVQAFPSAAMPPSGWRAISYSASSSEKWRTVDAASYPDYVHSGGYAAWVQYDAVHSQDEWLYSPQFTVPVSTTDTILSFWALSSTNYPTATVTLYVEDDLGTHVLWEMASENWDVLAYRQKQFSLSAYQGEAIKLIWRYHGVDGESFGLDDIIVNGPAVGLYLPLINDQ